MTYTLPDGTVYDLSRDYADTVGVTWTWTRARDRAGRPLMASRDVFGGTRRGTVPLHEVHETVGPLIPISPAPAPLPARRERGILPPLPRRTRHIVGGWVA